MGLVHGVLVRYVPFSLNGSQLGVEEEKEEMKMFGQMNKGSPKKGMMLTVQVCGLGIWPGKLLRTLSLVLDVDGFWIAVPSIPAEVVFPTEANGPVCSADHCGLAILYSTVGSLLLSCRAFHPPPAST